MRQGRRQNGLRDVYECMRKNEPFTIDGCNGHDVISLQLGMTRADGS